MRTGNAGKRGPGSTPAAMRWPATWGDGWWQDDEGDWTMFLSPWPVLSDVVCGPSAAVGQNRDAVESVPAQLERGTGHAVPGLLIAR